MSDILGMSYGEAALYVSAAGVLATTAGVFYARKQAKKDPNPRTPPPGGEPGPRGTSNSNTTPGSIGFIDRPNLLGQILNPPPQQAGVAGPRIAAICSLHGMGGIGKTELAREAARQLAPNVIAEVNLRGWDDSGQPMGEEEALRELCPQIDPATDPTTFSLPQLRAHWRKITSKGNLAVILDNLRDESLIEPLRPTAGITLITGRERIHRAGIQLVEVDVMEPDEAQALALATYDGLSEQDAANLARAVGYLPLAIALAAAYLARTGEAVSELARRVGQAAGGDARTLQGLFERVADLSTADLSDEQHARWLALSLPPGDFGLWTVQALWQDDDPQPELGELVHRHLILPAEDGRWCLHDLLRQYGRSVLAAEPAREQALWRQLGPAAVRRLGEIEERFRKGHDDMVAALAELDAELPLLRAVQEWAAERIETDAEAAAVASRLPNYSITQYRIIGDEALAWRQMSLRAAEHRGEKAEIATSAGNLGLAHRDREEWEAALAMFRKALVNAKELSDRAKMAGAYGNLGSIYRAKGKLDVSHAMHLKSLEIAKEIGNRIYIATQYGDLGLVLESLLKWEEAAEMQRKSAEIHEHMGNKPNLAIALLNLGRVLLVREDWSSAAECFGKGLKIAEELRLPNVQWYRQSLAIAEAHLARKENADGGPG